MAFGIELDVLADENERFECDCGRKQVGGLVAMDRQPDATWPDGSRFRHWIASCLECGAQKIRERAAARNAEPPIEAAVRAEAGEIDRLEAVAVATVR